MDRPAFGLMGVRVGFQLMPNLDGDRKQLWGDRTALAKFMAKVGDRV
ncbi:hypothetical protein H6G53_18455 [Limnothrix sp. FACHB-406]|nr:hypothetical protein [Limnothrix sp. FACHB-406]